MPSFDNAAKGVRKIFTAEILELISLLVTVIGSVLVAIVVATAAISGPAVLSSLGLVIAATVLILGGLVLGIIAFINSIVGLVQAKRDDSNYGTALACVIISLVVEVVTAILSLVMITNPVASEIATVLGRVADFFSVYFILLGTSTLLAQRGDSRMAEKGVHAFENIFIVFTFSILLRIVPIFLTGGVIEIVFLCAYAAVAIVAYIMYLSFLAGAYKRLADKPEKAN